MPKQNETSLAYGRIRGTSIYADFFSMLGIAITVGAIIYYAVFMVIDTNVIDAAINEEYASEDLKVTINNVSRTLAFILEVTPMIIGIYIFYQASLLFKQYKIGRVFTYQAASRLNRIGWAILSLAPIGILVETLTILALTLYNPAGGKQLAIGISETEVYAVILGLLLVTLAKILHEAAIISEENQAIV